MPLSIYTHGRRDQKKIALTFDDGPNPPRTDQILDILAKKKVQATFFVLGKWVERFPRAFRRIIDAGHTVGNHSYLHDGAETASDAVRLARVIPLIQALPLLIDEICSRGFELVGLDEMELVDPTVWTGQK